MTFPGSRAKRAQRAKRALYYIYNIVTVLPRSASGPARSRIDWISRSRSPACCRGRRPAEWVLFQQVLKFEKRSIRVGMRPSTPRVKVRKCAELRKNMQLSYCKSDQHIKLFL